VPAHLLLELFLGDVGVVLRGDDDRVDGLRREAVVAERDLGLAVGSQERRCGAPP
jgi:hypothetical protein